MLSRLFSSGGRSKSGTGKPKQKSSDLKATKDGNVAKKAMEGAERELYQYDQPTQELGMTDLIKRHEDGTRFMYAAVTGREPETVEAKLRRLMSFQPILKKKSIPIDNLPVIQLFKETESFPLDQIIPAGKAKPVGNYMRVSDAMTMYGAVVSPDCNFTKVKVGIADNRLLSDQTVKSFTATSNMMSRGNLALPYCIPVQDADQLILTISRERSFLEEGRQWGAIQVQLVIEFMMFPMQFENQTVVAQNMIPASALDTPLVNPNHVDVSVLNNNRDPLHQLFLSGELVDETAPIVDRSEAIKYAKSSMAKGQKKGQKIDVATSDWEFISKGRKSIPVDQNSIEPSDDGMDELRSLSLSSFSDYSEDKHKNVPGMPGFKHVQEMISKTQKEINATKKHQDEIDSIASRDKKPKQTRNVSFGESTVIGDTSESSRIEVEHLDNDIKKLTPFS
jgi:hypothetical protein